MQWALISIHALTQSATAPLISPYRTRVFRLKSAKELLKRFNYSKKMLKKPQTLVGQEVRRTRGFYVSLGFAPIQFIG
ncbi:hypothetical protein J2Z32_000487 [Paenibacillus turicensis]|uniref:Uncharacterized protein n=1 Tax=Paenibacillus turicensis TaxID=160487 RepID=A0ABS4FMR9_9BACL|nr:hypothetical protein [Paenibacillus turicensis]